MDGVDICDLGRADDRWDIEIALGRRRRPNADRFIGKPDVQSFPVGLGVDGDGLDAHLLACPHYPASDLAAIGDQYFAYLSHKNKLAAKSHKKHKIRNLFLRL